MLVILHTLLLLFGTAFVLGFATYGFGIVLKSFEKSNQPQTDTNPPTDTPTTPSVPS